MNMEERIRKRMTAGRQILFSREDCCLQPLQMLIDGSPRRAVICWALELAVQTAELLTEKHPGETRAEFAVEQSRRWARGEIKMPEAKRAILACHAAAKEAFSPEDIARFHAVGQACSTVHTNGHAIGFPIYDLTALIRCHGSANCENLIEQRIQYYVTRLMYWNSAYHHEAGPWASFL